MKKKNWKWFHILKWGDWVLYGLVAVIALVLLISAPRAAASGDGSAVVLSNGTVIARVAAADLAQGGAVSFEANGFHYQLAFENGRIRFSQADCPDQICVRTGWISRYGQIAACAPGQLILKIEADPEKQPTGTSEVDVIVG